MASAVLLAIVVGDPGGKGKGMEVWVLWCLGEGLEGVSKVVGDVTIPDGADLEFGLMGMEELRE